MSRAMRALLDGASDAVRAAAGTGRDRPAAEDGMGGTSYESLDAEARAAVGDDPHARCGWLCAGLADARRKLEEADDRERTSHRAAERERVRLLELLDVHDIDPYPDESESEERIVCAACDGSGEGQADGTRCGACGGSGERLTDAAVEREGERRACGG